MLSTLLICSMVMTLMPTPLYLSLIHIWHDEDCYPDEIIWDDEATPSDADRWEPEECPHMCEEESECISQKLNCRHKHDDECGYSPATRGTPCEFDCEICGCLLYTS